LYFLELGEVERISRATEGGNMRMQFVMKESLEELNVDTTSRQKIRLYIEGSDRAISKSTIKFLILISL
jgi:hypothetical protein